MFSDANRIDDLTVFFLCLNDLCQKDDVSFCQLWFWEPTLFLNVMIIVIVICVSSSFYIVLLLMFLLSFTLIWRINYFEAPKVHQNSALAGCLWSDIACTPHETCVFLRAHQATKSTANPYLLGFNTNQQPTVANVSKPTNLHQPQQEMGLPTLPTNKSPTSTNFNFRKPKNKKSTVVFFLVGVKFYYLLHYFFKEKTTHLPELYTHHRIHKGRLVYLPYIFNGGFLMVDFCRYILDVYIYIYT